MILLISSGAQRRYADDIVRALAHPAGTNFQFRYDKKYVAGTLDYRRERGGLVGEQALICYLSVDPSAKSTTLIPCRFAAVVFTQVIGSSWIITLEAGSFVTALDDPTVRARLTSGERTQIPAFDAQGTGPKGTFAIDIDTDFSANGSYAIGKRNMTAFESTAKALSADPHFSAATGVAFYHILAVRSSDRLWCQKRQVHEIQPNKGRYALQLGWRYWLEVYSYSPTGGARPTHPTSLTIGTAEPSIHFTSAAERVLDSRYDLNKFDFTSATAQLSLSAGLTMGLKIGGQTKSDESERRCDITLQAEFAGASLWTTARIFLPMSRRKAAHRRPRR